MEGSVEPEHSRRLTLHFAVLDGYIPGMRYRLLGSTGIQVSELAFGAGPISGLMTGTDVSRQTDVVRRAVEVGINWFDTAATYGNGQSEASLGAALRELDALDCVNIATKVRLQPEDLDNICDRVRASVEASLKRLGVPRVTLLQLHNSITALRGDEPTSLTPHDVLGPGGVIEAFHRLRDAGLVSHVGLTAIGQTGPLHEVVASGQFATIQVPFSLVNPSAGHPVPSNFEEANYGQIIAECERLSVGRGSPDPAQPPTAGLLAASTSKTNLGDLRSAESARSGDLRRTGAMGVFAIRVFAGGALIGQPPSPYTFQTKFFPLDLFHRDEQRAARLRKMLDGSGITLREAALRFVLSHSGVSSAIVGYGEPQHIDDAVAASEAGSFDPELLSRLLHAASGEICALD
jgi:aryl-alcohol dehydrogenase-like predicted oxidoreductase